MRKPRTNPLALAVLACLYERPMHPYEIDQTLRARSKHESIRLNYGSLYAVVDALAKQDLIRMSHVEREGQRPTRTVYEITEAGTTEMHDWLGSLLKTPVKEYPSFEAGLSLLPILHPDEAVKLLQERVRALESKAAEPRPTSSLPRIFLLEDEYEGWIRAAELQFVRDLLAELESGTLDGLDLWREAWESGRLDTSVIEGRLT